MADLKSELQRANENIAQFLRGKIELIRTITELTKEVNKLTKEAILFDYLKGKAEEENPTIEVTNEEIVDILMEFEGTDQDTKKQRRRLSRSIGWILKRHGLINRPDQRKRTGQKNTYYVISKAQLNDILTRFGYLSKGKNLYTQTPLTPLTTQESVNSGDSVNSGYGSRSKIKTKEDEPNEVK